MFRDQGKPKTEQPTEYYNITEGNPELRGNRTGEIINDPIHGPTLHLRPLIPNPTQPGKLLPQQGNGDVVFINISEQGWDAMGCNRKDRWKTGTRSNYG